MNKELFMKDCAIVDCVNCKESFIFEQGNVNEKISDQKGNPLQG